MMSDLIEIEPGVFQPKELRNLYQRYDQQLGIAFAIAKGVWHWKAKHVSQGERLHTTEAVLDALKVNGQILVSDHGKILGDVGREECSHTSTGTVHLRWIEKDKYLVAVEKLGKKVKA
jgi:hypothetical protein